MRAMSIREGLQNGSPQDRGASESDLTRTLIDDYLAEQQRLQTPVRRFADAQLAAPRRPAAAAAGAPAWRDLIPLSAPAAGEQYAFEVDLDRCTGCKACVAGCHSLNGLDEDETWRDVGLIQGGTRSQPFQQTITSACHHCEDPACLNGCPVLAYEKDPLTGIVRHLDDQCIGCQYCILKCPYDVPKYSKRLGIVRKCDLCHHRLAAGEAPACAQACPTEAIRIVTVRTGDAAAANPSFLSEAPDAAYTRPTTRYVTSRTHPKDSQAADAAALRIQPAHWPLVLMLTLMPMAVGAFCLADGSREAVPAIATAGWLCGALGLAASVFHLGKPLRAWRIFLGLRRSWLSREAVLFGVWFALVTVVAGQQQWGGSTMIAGLASHAASAVGICALFCSAMIYADTRRPFWRISQGAPRFLGTAAILGAGLAFALYPRDGYILLLVLALPAKLGFETRCLRALDEEEDETPTPDQLTARVLVGPLRPVLFLRYLAAVLVLSAAAAILTGNLLPSALARWALLALALLGEGAERYLFFRAVFAPKMPGVAVT
jgi:Fe-S-cluster-containing dehydrogenase component/DMSO reductase anchor subunit